MSSTMDLELQAIKKGYAAGVVDFDCPIDLTSVKGKSCLITGAASGLGLAFTEMLAQAGAHVVVADMNSIMGARTEKSLSEAGLRYQYVDVTSWDSQVSMLRGALAWVPNHELDIVITSAGIAPLPTDWTTHSPADLDAAPSHPNPMIATNVNLVGTFNTLTLVAKYGMGLHNETSVRGDKCVVLVGSVASYLGFSSNVDYCASKFAVRGVFQSTRHVLARNGVRLNMLAPTFIRTPLTVPLEAALQKMGAKYASIEDCVDAVARFCSDTRISGRCVVVTARGCRDVRDDIEGLNASESLIEVMNEGFLKAA